MRMFRTVSPMSITRGVIKWVLMCVIVLAPMILCYSWLNWTRWSAAQRHAAVLELVNSQSHLSVEKLLQGSEHMANVYTTFASLVAAVTAVVGCLTFVGWWLDYTHRGLAERDEHFKELQLAEMNRLYDLVNEFDRAVVALDWEGLRSYKIIGELYDRYRMKELDILSGDHDAGPKYMLLKKLDESFEKDADAAGILEPASVLFRILNWIYAHETYLQGSYAKDHRKCRDIELFRDRLLSLVGSHLTEQTKFVFGKYRHLRYHLEDHRPLVGLEKSRRYRGVQYADRLFAYERTLALFDPKIAKTFKDALYVRYVMKEGVGDAGISGLHYVELARKLCDN